MTGATEPLFTKATQESYIKRERALGALNGILLQVPLSASHKNLFSKKYFWKESNIHFSKYKKKFKNYGLVFLPRCFFVVRAGCVRMVDGTKTKMGKMEKRRGKMVGRKSGKENGEEEKKLRKEKRGRKNDRRNEGKVDLRGFLKVISGKWKEIGNWRKSPGSRAAVGKPRSTWVRQYVRVCTYESVWWPI